MPRGASSHQTTDSLPVNTIQSVRRGARQPSVRRPMPTRLTAPSRDAACPSHRCSCIHFGSVPSRPVSRVPRHPSHVQPFPLPPTLVFCTASGPPHSPAMYLSRDPWYLPVNACNAPPPPPRASQYSTMYATEPYSYTSRRESSNRSRRPAGARTCPKCQAQFTPQRPQRAR